MSYKITSSLKQITCTQKLFYRQNKPLNVAFKTAYKLLQEQRIPVILKQPFETAVV